MNIYTAIDAAIENKRVASESTEKEFWRGYHVALQAIVNGAVTLPDRKQEQCS